MKLQELVNNLSNKLAIISGDTAVYIKILGKEESAGEVTIEDTEKGQIIIIK